jgi:hypothetical protein
MPEVVKPSLESAQHIAATVRCSDHFYIILSIYVARASKSENRQDNLVYEFMQGSGPSAFTHLLTTSNNVMYPKVLSCTDRF